MLRGVSPPKCTQHYIVLSMWSNRLQICFLDLKFLKRLLTWKIQPRAEYSISVHWKALTLSKIHLCHKLEVGSLFFFKSFQITFFFNAKKYVFLFRCCFHSKKTSGSFRLYCQKRSQGLRGGRTLSFSPLNHFLASLLPDERPLKWWWDNVLFPRWESVYS